MAHEREIGNGRVTTPVGTKSRTKQSETEATNVNTIMRKFQRTGVIDHWNQRRPEFGDFSQSQSLQENMDKVMEASDAFNELDAHVRRAADNDPIKLLALMATEEGLESLRAAGMFLEPPIPIPPPQEPPTPAAEPHGGEAQSSEHKTSSTT